MHGIFINDGLILWLMNGSQVSVKCHAEKQDVGISAHSRCVLSRTCSMGKMNVAITQCLPKLTERSKAIKILREPSKDMGLVTPPPLNTHTQNHCLIA